MLSIAIKILVFPLQCIGFLIPTNTSIWVFGAWLGKSYNDNPKYLLSYVRLHQKHIRPIWLTKNKEVLKRLRHDGVEAYLFYSLRGIYVGMISGCVIICNSWNDLPFTAFVPRNKRIIQLWHGTPFRKVNLHKMGTLKKLLRFFFRTYLGREYDLVCTSTSRNKDILASKNRFSIEKDKIIVTGQPRTDVFFQKEKYLDIIPNPKKEKTLLYLPTWRNYPFNIFGSNYGFNFDTINRFLKKTHSRLVIKVHLNEFRKYSHIVSSNVHSNISLTFVEDIYPYMPRVDALLTDYSSVFFDFVLLDKPIIFLPFDFTEYSEQNEGFYYDYKSITPGPKAKKWDDALLLIQSIQAGGDPYKNQRRKLSEIFNAYNDGKNCQRVFDEISLSLKK